MKVLRPLAGGGCSYCSCPDDKVGKNRCRHLPVSFQSSIVDRVSYVDLESNTMKFDYNKLDDYVKNMKLPEEKVQKILKFFA